MATYRALFTETLTHQGIPYYFLEAQASEATIRQRLKQRNQQPQVVSDARLDDFDRLNQAYHEPKEMAGKHWLIINTEIPLQDTLSDVLYQLRVSDSIEFK